MANEKVKAKSGMEGKTSQTERWGTRADVKAAAKKRRRRLLDEIVRESQELGLYDLD